MGKMYRVDWLVAFTAIGLCLASTHYRSSRGGEGISPKKAIQAIANALAKGDSAAAKKFAANYVKHEEEPVHEAMEAFEPRNKGGFGVGSTPGAIMPDSIEKRIQTIAKVGISTPKLKKESAALIEMAQRVAAMSQITDLTLPKKNQALWKEYSSNMRTSAGELIKAIKGGEATAVRTATAKVNSNCNNCHSKFR